MIKIAILGCGTVASGVCELLGKNEAVISNRIDEQISIKKLLARSPQKALDLGFVPEQLCSSIDDIVNDDEIEIVVELIGGTTTAFDYIKTAITHGKHVVTANKDLIAQRGCELFALADKHGVDLYFEASVGGGIPIIQPLKQSLSGNRFSQIVGILNGTTNFILTKMSSEGLSYSEALKTAQDLGFAEANPASDVMGTDAARKITILAGIAFDTQVTLDDVYCEGITDIDDSDIALAHKMGYVIKLLAVAREVEGKLLMFVRPAFVPVTHPLASVNDSFNAVFLHGDAVGDIMLYGRGAGSLPTASAVVGDIMDICRNIRHGVHGRYRSTSGTDMQIAAIDELYSSFFVRLKVSDKPKVLAGVATAFGENGVSLLSLIQNPNKDKSAELIIITHPAKEKAIRDSLSLLMQKDYVNRIHTFMCLGLNDE
ncbi:MAG: homoserine dehydrogenase [Oscillospiraceae bacterium]